MSWLTALPDLSGKTALITGGTGGIGLETARALAQAGAKVIITGRNQAKGQAAQALLAHETSSQQVQFLPQDLASQESIRHSVDALKNHHKHLHLLINNAGVMWLQQGLSSDGHEIQFATNHLGHFALTLQLLPLLLATPGSRIVTVSSIAHTNGRIHFDDINLEQGYGRQKAYAQSKLANLFFAFELDRRLKQLGSNSLSVACHPGVASSDLSLGLGPRIGKLVKQLTPLVAQSTRHGAQPSLLAATGPAVAGGDFYGPRYYMVGPAGKPRARRYAYHAEDAARLWALSEQLTGQNFP